MQGGQHLDGRDLWGQAEAAVIAMGHHNAADEPRADSPGRLVHKLLGVVLVDKRRAECLGKVLSQVMAGASLHTCTLRVLQGQLRQAGSTARDHTT